MTIPDCIPQEFFGRSQDGRLTVDDQCRVCGHHNIYAIGDVSYPELAYGNSFPQCSQLAVTHAHYLADALSRMVDHLPLAPFECGDWRSARALLIGQDCFVSQIGGQVLSGSFTEITTELGQIARTDETLLPYLDTLLKEELERRKREVSFLKRELAHSLMQE